MRIARGIVAALAVVICAWFVVGARQAHETDAAAAIIANGPRLSPAQADHAASMLRAAKSLNPDTIVDVLRAELDLDQGDRKAARTILERVVSSEPDNAAAWEWLAKASVGDLREFYLAAFRIEQLVPPVRAAR